AKVAGIPACKATEHGALGQLQLEKTGESLTWAKLHLWIVLKEQGLEIPSYRQGCQSGII
ncbi:hypothetical protein ACR8H7_22225, partial [Salmonella enterica subsp. enterica serovar Paratyphi A]